jgi:hypothetical protein
MRSIVLVSCTILLLIVFEYFVSVGIMVFIGSSLPGTCCLIGWCVCVFERERVLMAL